jgi:hypothetical protein
MISIASMQSVACKKEGDDFLKIGQSLDQPGASEAELAKAAMGFESAADLGHPEGQ